MTDQQRVAVITGANRGMGFETCRQLAERGMVVVLTSRDVQAGECAAGELREEGLSVAYHPLDVTDQASVDTLRDHLVDEHGRVDVLVNNAGVMLEPSDPGNKEGASIFNTELDLIRQSLETNAFGALRCCLTLIPEMRKHEYGRIVNVSTGMASLASMGGGWPGYRISKSSLNVVTRILATELSETNIKVNSVCPGFVRTDLGGDGAPRSIEEGVDTTLWLATLRDEGPNGGFYRDCKAIEW
ncbi:MAG: SDR family oxidoreductase [Deltaproteobacteria bacterium]|nr:SDR family oxidoreductase [Deltaproteobacteria bacterium]